MDVERVEALTRELLIALGRDPDHPSLKMTPKRSAQAWAELLSGYSTTAAEVMKTQDGDHFDGDKYDQAIVMRDIAFVSLCEHHLLPFIGTAGVAYIPGDSGRVVGASKLVRLVDMHARRLQMQERMTQGIANDLESVIDARGVAVIVGARHLCMCARGIRRDGATMVTSALKGAFYDKPEARAEVLRLLER